MIDLREQKILLLGHNGFLGSHVAEVLRGRGARVLSWATPNGSGKPDLSCETDCFRLFKRTLPDYVVNCAGQVGGLGMQDMYPASLFMKNTMIGLNVLQACETFKVKKVVSVLASCGYPSEEWSSKWYEDGWKLKDREICIEDDFLDGLPHSSVAPHAYAKRNILIASQSLNQQCGLQALCACPTTMYGPRDSFDPANSHVVGSMIHRFVETERRGDRRVTCWGSGAPLRELLYVEDAAELLVQTLEHYGDCSNPINLGSGEEISIKTLAETVAESVKYDGDIGWDTSRPDGSYRKRLDLTRQKKFLPGVIPTPFSQGLQKTIQWYKENHC